MDAVFRAAADAMHRKATTGEPSIPGVVAMASGRAGNLYEGAAGVRRLGGAEPMTTDSVFALFSCSKAITGTAVLQLVEQGLLDLDAPAKRYASEIGELMVLDGFDEEGEPMLRPPKREVATRMLMLHTSGAGYHYFDAGLKRLIVERGGPDPRLGKKRGLMAPVLFDPGDQWAYGLGIDWCGCVWSRAFSANSSTPYSQPARWDRSAWRTPPSSRRRRCGRGALRCTSAARTAG
jgi:methyl acetate hydrolase